MIGLVVNFPKFLFQRALFPGNAISHELRLFLFNIMSKRSFTEKDTKKNKARPTMSDKKFGYGGINAVIESTETSSTAGTTQSPSAGPSRKSKRLADILVAKGGVAPSPNATQKCPKTGVGRPRSKPSPSGVNGPKPTQPTSRGRRPPPPPPGPRAGGGGGGNARPPSPPTDNAAVHNFEYLQRPVKSPNDSKEYRMLRLRNGLRALLVSDVRADRELEQCLDDSSSSSGEGEEDDSEGSTSSSDGSDSDSIGSTAEGDNLEGPERDVRSHHRPMEEKLAAVGLTVGVGSFSDPVDIPGLAHFLEHMVFMGSAKYPRENDFDSFIRRHGGSDNAQTAFETTTFYFECQDKHLLKGMDKFAQFFQRPLLKKEAMTREREAVESEFQESKSSDGDRLVQLMAGVVARPDHPASKFTWGNAATLRDGVDEERLQSALHAFRSRHYSGHRMTLAVEARLPMEELESLVASSFSDIPSNYLPPDDFSPYVGSFDTPQFNRLYRVASVKDRTEVLLTWSFPSFLRDYKNKPYEYLESLFDHEGRGSLLAHLRDRLWALEIASGEAEAGFEDNSMFFLFSITILLTEEGYKHVDEVVAAVFAYLSMLRADSPSRRYFDELSSMAETNFVYADEIPPGEYVEQLSEAMQYYEPVDVLAARYLMYNYDQQAIKDFQDGMTPDRVNVVISSKDASVDYDRVEKWFETRYSVTDIPARWLEAWRRAGGGGYFHIPAPNAYIPTELSILPPDKDELTEEYPCIIEATKLCEVWYKRDTKFNLPVAYYMLYLVSPLPSASPINSALLDVYSAMLEYHLAADLYAARLASISYVVSPADNGIKIRVGGFNEKLPLVMETIAQHMASFKDNFNEDMFNSVKNERTKMYYNRFIKPDRLNSDLRLQMLVWRYWTSVSRHAALLGATKQMLLDFVYDYHNSFYIQALVQGNVTRQQALQACHKITSILHVREIPDFQYPEFRVSKIDVGSRLLRVGSFNREDSNSVITSYYQCGLGTIKNCCILELVLSLMEEPLFDTLRTKEQLGYSVDCVMKDTYGVIGYTITVNYQEDKFSIDHVDQRIEAFLENFTKTFGKMKPKKLEEARKTLVKLKQCSDVHLKEECGRHWGEILSTSYLFDRLRREVDCLNTITFKEVRAWVSQHMENKSHVRKLSIQVVGNPAPRKTLTRPGEPKKTPSKHKGSNVFNPPHPFVDRRLSDVELPTLPQLPGPQHSLDIVTPADRPDRAIADLDQYRQSLSVYPLHRILQ